jgi:hypothetical protein
MSSSHPESSAPFAVSDADLRTLHGQPCWGLRHGGVELAVTQLGGHMADVRFRGEGGRLISPYYVSPWQEEGRPLPAPVLVPLRGEFFCLPFGGNGTPHRGERHPPHGETAGSRWTLDGVTHTGAVRSLNLSLTTQVRPGRVRRELQLVDGHSAVYSRTFIEDFVGPAPFAHHAILAGTSQEGALRITVRPFKLGLTCPHVFSKPEQREYQALARGAEFSDLSKVPSNFRDQPVADCSSFPARRGFADLIGTFIDPADNREPDWVAAVNNEEGWLWFALKDAAVMPGRAYWMENHGRHGSPWDGRNCCIGLEDGCMYFDAGLAESAGENAVNRQGIPTCRELEGEKPFPVYYVQGAIPVPLGFDRVETVKFEAEGVEFTGAGGRIARAAVRPGFVFDGVAHTG